MKLGWTIIGLIMVAAGVGQPQYRTELLQRRYHWVAGSRTDLPHVNAIGNGFYTTRDWLGNQALNAWKDGTCLNWKYLGPLSQGQVQGFNDRGQCAYTAIDQVSNRAMVDGRDFYTEVFPASTDSTIGVYMVGVDGSGLPLWSRHAPGIPNRRYHGDQMLRPYLSMSGTIGQAINARGDCLWSGGFVDSGDSDYDMFLNDTDISKPILGSNRFVTQGGRLNAAGDVLWTGRGDATGGLYELFLNSTSIAAGLINSHNGPDPVRVTNNGHILWNLVDSSGVIHGYRDTTEISGSIFGSDDYGSAGAAINEEGDIAWSGIDLTTNYGAFFRNSTDITTPALGTSVHGTGDMQLVPLQLI